MRRKTDIRAQQRMEELAGEGLNGAEIAGILEGEFGDRAPNLRTVQRWVKKLRRPDDSEPWSLDDVEEWPADDIARVTETVAVRVLHTGGRRYRLSSREAKWARIVGKVAPDLPAVSRYLLVRQYTLRGGETNIAPDIDFLLTLAPWRSVGAGADLWQTAVDRGHAPGDQVGLAWACLTPGRGAGGSEAFEEFAKRVQLAFDDREEKLHYEREQRGIDDASEA